MRWRGDRRLVGAGVAEEDVVGHPVSPDFHELIGEEDLLRDDRDRDSDGRELDADDREPVFGDGELVPGDRELVSPLWEMALSH